MLLTLIRRSYCSLCDKLRDALLEAAARHGISIQLMEIDLDDLPAHTAPTCEAQYGELVPVLIAGELNSGVEICHYHFDEPAWLAAMTELTAATQHKS
jgi:Glutaredoxin-like domain (DUF836)